VENPVIKNIVYKTGRKLKEDDIVDKLKEKDEYILPYSYYSPAKIQRITQTIKELLEEKGLTGGEANVDINKEGKNEIEVIFRIKEGSRIKVGEVVFEGNSILHSSALNGAMKENKKHGLVSWVTGKDTFKQNLLSEDLSRVRDKLREKGYMEAIVGKPRIEEITKRSIFLKKKKMKRIIIPVQAGERYFVGDIKIEGTTIIPSKYLRPLVKLKEGDIYSSKARGKAVEKIEELYRNFGHLYAQVMPVENLDPKRKRVNVTFNIHEGEVAYLNRLEIKGNTYTKDKVIRREILIREGDRFSFELFKNSVLRLGQLGLVELEKDPDIKPNPGDPTKIDVTISVKELQRNNIQFSAGYSGYQGTFVAFSYSTVNFLGAGENLELMAQYGKRIKNYSFGFTEPYFLDLPINLGFKVYNLYTYYPSLFTQQSRGVNFNFGARVKGFWRTGITYGFEYVEVGPVDEGDEEDPYVYPYYYGSTYGYGSYFVGSLSPVIYRSTVDSPLTPSRGTMYLVGCKFSGGILGGEISLLKPRFEWTFYHPIIRNHVIGFHLEYQFIKPLGDSEVPFWERFYLGGERSIRGYEIYTIGPRTEEGANIGGDKSLVFNAEYIIHVGGPLYTILFYDLGNAYDEDENFSFNNLYSSTGLEMRIFVPALRVPFRLIFSYNNRKIYKDDSSFAFRFAIGTTF
jgi:outer membrane protein insertion porin family